MESPLYISSRLMAALDVPGAGTIHVTWDRLDAENRVVYRYVVEAADGSVIAEGDDMRSGVGAPVDYRDAVGTLLAFLAFAADQYRTHMGDDDGPADGWVFPPDVCEWAYMNEAELLMAEADLDGSS